jgi:hypothetical protein
MSTQTTDIGEILIPVGHYQKEGGATGKRYRKLGTLLETTHDDGHVSRFMRLNAEVLSPSLLILARQFAKKGDDTVIVSVFEKRDKTTAPESTECDADDQAF